MCPVPGILRESVTASLGQSNWNMSVGGVNNALSGGPLALPPLHSENVVAPNLTQSSKRAKGLIFKKNRRLTSCGPSLRDGITSNDLWITLETDSPKDHRRIDLPTDRQLLSLLSNVFSSFTLSLPKQLLALSMVYGML
ncbi:hypothetical protein RUM43_012642 [Polyplax serrata]|uniref:Uncharacterized protein n=1 Tax=Polyplax serrata TaxID=468196 RepID=A0AAN8PSS8_POLSC